MPSEIRVDKVSSTTSPYDAVFSTTGGALSHRNVIINGAMQVAQRATSQADIGASDGYFTVDRWHLDTGGGTSGRLTMSQDSDSPNGFANSLKLDCTTADTSIAAGELLILQQRLEGQDLQRFAKGTSEAKAFMVSFYVKGNASATYVCELFDGDNSRQISKSFNVTTSWTRVELAFPADTTGAFDDDNALSLYLQIWVHAGANYTSGTLNSSAWASPTGANRAAGITSFFDSTDRTFFLTGAQIEVGTVATPFEHRSFADELARCQRYYQKFERTSPIIPSNHISSIGAGIWYTTNQILASFDVYTLKRATPTLTVSSDDWAYYYGSSVGEGSADSSSPFDVVTPNTARINITTSSSRTAGWGTHILLNDNETIEVNAEL